MTRPVLSICIPTFDRGAYIGETLESIASQAMPGLEVIVADNASQDETKNVVDGFRERFERLLYWRSAENQGFSRNFMQAVDLASGRYAWLLGSDDVLLPGAIETVLRETDAGHRAFVFDRFEWDPTTERRWPDPVLSPDEPRDLFDLGLPEELRSYFTAGRSITAMFSFISTVVFERAAWDESTMRPEWHRCAFPHAMRLFSMYRAAGGKLRYVRVPLVLNRLGNDTFNPGGRETIRRLLMDYDGYQRIIDEHWADSPEIAALAKRVMRRTHPHIDVLKFRRIVRRDQLSAMTASLRYFDYGEAFASFYGTDAAGAVVRSLRSAHRILLPSRSAH